MVEVTESDVQKANEAFDIAFSADPEGIDKVMTALFATHRIEAAKAERGRLQPKIEALEAELAKAKVPQWFYHPDYTEGCEFSPWDVIDGRYDPEPGDHVFEIECARPLPSIWCAVRVTADPDADERFTFTEHSSEAEAHKALEGSGNG